MSTKHDQRGSSAPPPAIDAEKLCKTFGNDLRAVDSLDLVVPQGATYALLGPNGAGKTTTISILTTLSTPTSGSARIRGHDVVHEAARVRRDIGVTFQEMVLDDALTGRQVLDYHGRLYGLPTSERHERTEELLALAELSDAAGRKCKEYSGGMKRRLELARALMTVPRVLFLDEPTLGLDPQGRARIWDYIRDLKQRTGLTVLLTTHYLDEAQHLADRVGIMDRRAGGRHPSCVGQRCGRRARAAVRRCGIRSVVLESGWRLSAGARIVLPSSGRGRQHRRHGGFRHRGHIRRQTRSRRRVLQAHGPAAS